VISNATANVDQSNASRLRMEAILALLKREKARRAKEQGIERDGQGRGR
jgi:hypothetical protein